MMLFFILSIYQTSHSLILKIDHPIYLYHKGNMESLKSDLSDFQLQFLTGNPYFNSVETNWIKFKEAVSNAITTHIPQKNIKTL